MNLWKFRDMAIAGGVSLSLLVLSGCGGSATTSSSPKDEKTKDEHKATDAKPSKDEKPSSSKKEALKPGKAVVKGTVKFEGDEPDLAKLNAALVELVKEKAAPDKDHCLAPSAPETDKEQQAWRINKTNKGLKNVVVFLVPEQGTYFANSADDDAVKAVKDKSLDIHQPFCEFHPHTAVLFPKFRDEKNKEQITGQTVTVFNDTDKSGGKAGGVAHNTKWSGGSGQSEGNATIPPGGKKPIDDLIPQRSPVTFQCSIHPWMNATVWVLDNPYFAVTDEDGNFEIKNAPVGNVRIVVWHEAAAGNYLNSGEGKGETIELKDGENKKDFTAKK